MITVVVNEMPREVAQDQTIGGLLGELLLPLQGIAVAVNGEVVRRAQWDTRLLRDGDRLDVLTAAQGG